MAQFCFWTSKNATKLSEAKFKVGDVPQVIGAGEYLRFSVIRYKMRYKSVSYGKFYWDFK